MTVKMRAGWNEQRDQRARAGADGRGRRRGRRGRARPDGGAVLHRRIGLVADRRVAAGVSIPVFGSGDCVEAGADRRARLRDAGVTRRARRPRRASQSVDLQPGGASARRRQIRDAISLEERGQFLLDYIDLLLNERVDEADGLPTRRAGPAGRQPRRARRAAASAGSSTSFARSAPGTPRASTTARTCASRSTQPSRSRSCAAIIEDFFLPSVGLVRSQPKSTIASDLRIRDLDLYDHRRLARTARTVVPSSWWSGCWRYVTRSVLTLELEDCREFVGLITKRSLRSQHSTSIDRPTTSSA